MVKKLDEKNKKNVKGKKTISKVKTFYITTPIYYVNDVPHIGHAYTTIAADVIARWHRISGEDVFFLTGTDEHGQKIAEAAAKNGKEPKQFVDDTVWVFINAWNVLKISYSDFIRTTDQRHEDIVKKIVKEIYERGDIYKGEYEGWYCVPCESFWTELQLKEEKCPDCGRGVKKVTEEAYFFRLSKYQDRILEHFRKNRDFVCPKDKKKEMVNRIKEGLKDLCITRKTVAWGIPFPLDESHTMYVWVEALMNYVTGLGYPGEKFKKYWPADVHLVGKEINWFHSVIWPCLLWSMGLEAPKKIFAHGWWTVDGEKMSKSVGNVVDPLEMSNKYGVDVFRYFLLREVPFGSDGDFSEKNLITRNNSELANDLGNLVNRVAVMAEKYFSGKIPKGEKDKELEGKALEILKKVKKNMDKLELSEALLNIWGFVGAANKYITDKEPWKIEDKKELGNVIYNLAEALKFIGIIVNPFIPDTSLEILRRMGIGGASLKDVKWAKIKFGNIEKGELLFRKIETEKDDKAEISDKAKTEDKKIKKGDYVSFEDFKKLDIRIGRILKVEKVEGADKLLKLDVDLGEEKRTIVAGIAESYGAEELLGKEVPIIANLEPRMIRGIESRGMILAAVENGKPIILNPEKEVEPGTKVS